MDRTTTQRWAGRREPGWIDRLRRRKLVQWLTAYLAIGWLALQLLDVVGDIWQWPNALARAVSMAIGLGMLPVVVVAWFHGEKGRQRVCRGEVLIVGALVAGIAVAIARVCFSR